MHAELAQPDSASVDGVNKKPTPDPIEISDAMYEETLQDDADANSVAFLFCSRYRHQTKKNPNPMLLA